MRPLPFVVFNAAGELVARLVYADDAAALVSAIGPGSIVCSPRHLVLWVEGRDGDGRADENRAQAVERMHLRGHVEARELPRWVRGEDLKPRALPVDDDTDRDGSPSGRTH